MGNGGQEFDEGPDQLTLNTWMQRTFRPHGKWYLDVSVNATNTLNHVTFTNWNNVVTNDQFGLPASTGGMRSLQTTLHLRWQMMRALAGKSGSMRAGKCAGGDARTTAGRRPAVHWMAAMRNWRFAFFFGCGGFASAAGGWEPEHCDARFTIKVQSNLVVEAVEVKDKQGHFVQGLTAKDFVLTEDGVPQTIKFCEQRICRKPPSLCRR